MANKGIGAFCSKLLLEGKGFIEVRDAAKAEFGPTCKTSTDSVAWYSSKLGINQRSKTRMVDGVSVPLGAGLIDLVAAKVSKSKKSAGPALTGNAAVEAVVEALLPKTKKATEAEALETKREAKRIQLAEAKKNGGTKKGGAKGAKK
jgi:hypothetical protein